MLVRPMTEAEFDHWRRRLVLEYAQDQVTAGTWSADEAERRSAEGLDEELPDGQATADQVFLTAEDEQGAVGIIWLSLTHPRGAPDTAWISDLEVVAERRGQGLGRALLAEAEREIADRGIGALGLNVFGYNASARRLYDSAGYHVVTQQMRKQLR